MYKRLATAFALSAMAISSALAQSDKPTDFEPGMRAVFVNEDNTAKNDQETMAGFASLDNEQRRKISDNCSTMRAAAKPGTTDNATNDVSKTDPVPGVFDMARFCDLVIPQ